MEEKKVRILSKLTLFDDALFKLFAKDQKFIEEILQVVFVGRKFKIIKFSPQYEVYDLMHKSIRVDILVLFDDGTLVNVEIQRRDDDDHIKRCRYYGSLITLDSLGKGQHYSEMCPVCIIYITKKDFLGYGKVIYHTKRTIQENGKILNDGLEEIFINAEVDDGSKLSRLMKMMSNVSYVSDDFSRFKELKESFYDSSNNKGGNRHMVFTELDKNQVYEDYQLEWLQQGRQEGMQQGRQEGMQQGRQEGIQQGRQEGMQQGTVSTLVDLVKDNTITIEIAAKKAKMTEADFRLLLQ